MRTFTVTTRKKDQIVDITDTVENYLQQEKNEQGLCSLFVAHTTCALTTSDLDPGTDLDLIEDMRHLLPRLAYRHPHDPDHAPDHLLSSIYVPSLVISYAMILLIMITSPRIF